MGRSGNLPRSAGETDGDDTGCTVLHVDMDAFFASVEIRSRPELRGRPVVVGGMEGRGVVAAASYEARRFGVHSAMSMAQALRLCPQAVVISPSRGAYTEASRAIMAIFAEFTPLVEPLSLDEAFLDVSGAIGLFGRPAEIARQIRARVLADQQLTCSVGIATIKSVAKLASSSCKPDGLRVVPRAGTLDFLHPLPVTALWGVGDKTAAPLHGLGIRTVGELAATPLDTLRRAIGVAAGEHLHALANGRDDRAVVQRAPEKSVSTDRTLAHDLQTEDEVARELLRGAGEVGERLRLNARQARTVGIKIRFADFTTITRVRTLDEPTNSSATIHEVAMQLYRELHLDRPRIRLVGVKAENLRNADEPTQLALDFPTGSPRAGMPRAGALQASAPEAGAPQAGLERDGTRADGPPHALPPAHSARTLAAPTGPVAARDHERSSRRRDRDAAAERAVDALTARFGQSTVRPASLIGMGRTANEVTRSLPAASTPVPSKSAPSDARSADQRSGSSPATAAETVKRGRIAAPTPD
ncbi:DNA polymerase IV [Jatrophihabitans telluris]|uniref:DNA polymerase IV n=1 Tax=Jatrophihabitans telluris TaxID=2038343 RepID=A0ABY4QVP7_9ACTN|nr:DNA polymerase IV [Jatrophihabitans telluris]UQX87202.1 DNA polymerase IV [Jatrophihabitans telluris]